MLHRRILTVLAAALVGACVAPADESKRLPAGPVSRSASKAPAADLRKVADDTKVARSDRVAAVFALFANYLRPPCSAATAGAALGDAGWLTDASLCAVTKLLGAVPVEFGGEGTVFCLNVLPIKGGRSDWVVYFRLSGAGRTAADALAFLRGRSDLKGKPELVEFALCYPDAGKATETGRVERFSPAGLKVSGSDK
jgi:hypothetical protein